MIITSTNQLIYDARNFAKVAHEGQVRKYSGLPYFTHCEAVADITRQYGGCEDQIASAFLHDVIEDTKYTFYQLKSKFNRVIAAIVQELTNEYTKGNYPNWKRKQRKDAELERIKNISKTSKLVKLADRHHNILSLSQEEPAFGPNYYYVKETLDLLEVLKDVCLPLEEQIKELCEK